jgi:hypothetical protein
MSRDELLRLPPGAPVRCGPDPGKPGRPSDEPAPRPMCMQQFLFSLRHFFPPMPQWLAEVPDPRARPEACTYSMPEIIMLALLMLCCQYGSRRQLDQSRICREFVLNLQTLLDDDEAGATCADNMNRVLEMVDPRELEKLAVRFTKTLNRSKVLRKFKCDGMLVVAVDGTQVLSFNERHCPHCLTRDVGNGKIQYYHYVLAAKIVTPVGLILPAAFEFVENPSGKFDKQDCEIKAFKRLAPRLARLLKGFRLLLVGDGLYANEPFMKACEARGWSYVVTLKDDCLPTLQEQVRRAKQGLRVVDGSGRPGLLPTRGSLTEADEQMGRTRTVDWITPLRYHGRIVHWLEMTESDSEKQTYHNVWITDLKPDKRNAMALAKAGRMRWKIENEGINTQKNGGYEMEHGYGVKGNAWKNYYLLMQIAQLFNDLCRLGDLTQKLTQDLRSTFAEVYGSFRNFVEKLRQSLATAVIDPRAGPDPGTIQIRLPDPPMVYRLE